MRLPQAAACLLAGAGLIATPAAAGELVFAIIGDFVTSGEGNPDDPAVACAPPSNTGSTAHCGRLAVWRGTNKRAQNASDNPCHRGAGSGYVQALERLEGELANGDTVRFDTFACSGEDPDLTGDGYTGDDTTYGGSPLPAQLRQVAAAFPAPQRIDGLIVSIGANDVGFGPTVASCVTSFNCQEELTRSEGDQQSIFDQRRAELKRRYDDLAAAIRTELGDRVGHVFITEYMDPTRRREGDYCGRTLPTDARWMPGPPPGDPLLWTLGYYEAQFASDVVIPALNAEVKDAAQRHRWILVDNISAPFRSGPQSERYFDWGGPGRLPGFRTRQVSVGHGFCNDRDTRWVRDVNDALALQGSTWGSLHPNRSGHTVIATALSSRLRGFGEQPARSAPRGSPPRPSATCRSAGPMAAASPRSPGPLSTAAPPRLRYARRAGRRPDPGGQRLRRQPPPRRLAGPRHPRRPDHRHGPGGHAPRRRGAQLHAYALWSVVGARGDPAGDARRRRAPAQRDPARFRMDRQRTQRRVPAGPRLRGRRLADRRPPGAGRRTGGLASHPGDARVDDGRADARRAVAARPARDTPPAARCAAAGGRRRPRLQPAGCSPWSAPVRTWIGRPATPTGLRSDIAGSAMQVRWDAVEGAVAYQFAHRWRELRLGQPDGGVRETSADAPRLAEFPLTNRQASYRVRACNLSGCSDWSAPLGLQLPPATAGMPATLSVASPATPPQAAPPPSI